MTLRAIIDGFRESLHALSAAGMTGADAMEAFATLHQLVGRLDEIDRQDQYKAAVARCRPAIELIDPDLPIQHVEAALHMARETMAEEEEDAMDQTDSIFIDILEAAKRTGEADAYLLSRDDVRGMASRF